MAVSRKKITALMDIARELFWKHGLKRVSVEEICEKAGVSKMTFYRHFDNKTELAKAVYIKVVEESRQRFRSIFTDESTSTAEKLELMVKLKLDGTNEISREFINDFYSSPEEGMAEFVNNLTSRVWNEMISDFKLAQEKGCFRQDFNPEAFFIMSQKLIELVNDDNYQQLFSSPQEMILEMTRIFTYGIGPYNKTGI